MGDTGYRQPPDSPHFRCIAGQAKPRVKFAAMTSGDQRSSVINANITSGLMSAIAVATGRLVDGDDCRLKDMQK